MYFSTLSTTELFASSIVVVKSLMGPSRMDMVRVDRKRWQGQRDSEEHVFGVSQQHAEVEHVSGLNQ